MREDFSDGRVIKADVPLREGINQTLIHAIGSAQTKLARLLVVAVDGASLSTGELHRLCDDGGEYSFEIERRVHRLGDLAKCLQLADRAAEIVCALTQFIEQSCILSSNNGLGGEVLHQFDLLLGERTYLLAIDRYNPNQIAFLEHWNGDLRSSSA